MEANRLKRLEECKGKIREIIGDEGIMQLAKDNLIPHYVIYNPITKEESIWFMSGELNQWFDQNCLSYRQGFFEQSYNFMYFDKDLHKADEEAPEELLNIRNLYCLPKGIITTPPGVYFLCKNGEIVYIGQAINVAARITTHITEGLKDFDQIYYISCQRHRLNDLEMALIRMYKPKYNKVGTGKMTDHNKQILESILNT